MLRLHPVGMVSGWPRARHFQISHVVPVDVPSRRRYLVGGILRENRPGALTRVRQFDDAIGTPSGLPGGLRIWRIVV
jgi:hypothetical protein